MEMDLPGILEGIQGPVALAFSYQAEDVAALHLLLHSTAEPRDLEVFTLDTLKLFPETQGYHEAVEAFFQIPIKRYYPDPDEVRQVEEKLGEWGMRGSLEDRHYCCNVRKVAPLKRALAGKSVWVTGLRAAQSPTRSNLQILEYDESHKLMKINPLVSWSEVELAVYLHRYGLPLHPLYAQGFKSIGCAPCTRAVKEGEDIRAGRWWWENPEHKECGLHLRKAGTIKT
ncbi:MAG: phosphoadenylyl-sulfate reductase [Treponema sp.]|jgi:phosphoadenosine phosphosulfate reductase|nr:phosphoadenylyl-sulfate reductase [Treponema sp.]